MESEIWAVGDSHLSKQLEFFQGYGVHCTAVRGGTIEHVLRISDEKLASCFIVMAGGNDLVEVTTDVVMRSMNGLVKRLADRRRVSCVITGSMIPRSRVKGFTLKCKEFDEDIEQSDVCHHHFVTDLFYDHEKGPNGVLEEYYIGDKTHLNGYGIDLLQQLLEWVVGCYYAGEFTQTRVFSTVVGKKRAYWKF